MCLSVVYILIECTVPDKNVFTKSVIKTFVKNLRIELRFWYDFATVFNLFK